MSNNDVDRNRRGNQSPGITIPAWASGVLLAALLGLGLNISNQQHANSEAIAVLTTVVDNLIKQLEMASDDRYRASDAISHLKLRDLKIKQLQDDVNIIKRDHREIWLRNRK